MEEQENSTEKRFPNGNQTLLERKENLPDVTISGTSKVSYQLHSSFQILALNGSLLEQPFQLKTEALWTIYVWTTLKQSKANTHNSPTEVSMRFSYTPAKQGRRSRAQRSALCVLTAPHACRNHMVPIQIFQNRKISTCQHSTYTFSDSDLM